MKRSTILRSGSSFIPPDAEAVIRVVFESARRSGVDVAATSSSNSNLSSSSSQQGISSSSSSSSLLHLSHPSTTSEAAKRQARDYAMRVQKFRDQQRKVSSSRSVPAATVQYSIRQKTDGTGNEEEDDDDPLSSLFSHIDGPKLKNMTKPLAAPAKPVPSLFDEETNNNNNQQDADASSLNSKRKTSPLPKVVVASKSGASPLISGKKRPPSPTRKTTSLKKTIVERVGSLQQTQSQFDEVVSSPDEPKKYFFGEIVSNTSTSGESMMKGLKLNVPQLEIDVKKRILSATTPAANISTSPKKTTTTTTTTTTAFTTVVTPVITQHAEAAKNVSASPEEPSTKTIDLKQETSSSSFQAVSRPTFESTSSSTTTSATSFTAPASAFQQQTAQTATTATTTLRREDENTTAAADDFSLFLKQQEEMELLKKKEAASESTLQSSSSVEDWASLRAQELEQIKKEREATALLEKQEKLLKEEGEKIAAWIKSRTPTEAADPLTHFAGKTPAIKELNELYVAATWESAFTAFNKIHKQPTTNQETLSHALCLAAAHTWKWRDTRKTSIQASFDAITTRIRLPAATKNLLTMLLQSEEAATQNFITKMTDEERAQLPRFLFERCSHNLFDHNFQAGTWEANLQFVQNMKKLRTDPFLRLETILLRSVSHQKNRCGAPAMKSQMTEVVHSLEQQCRSKLSQLGRQHAVVLMYAFARLRAFPEAKRIFYEMKERNDLDEDIAAAFIRISNTPAIENTIPELRKNKINVLSSACTRAIVYSMCGRGETAPAIETIRAFSTVTPIEEWSIFDIRAAVLACEKHMNPVSKSRDDDDSNNNKVARQHSLPPDAGIVDTIRGAALATWKNAEVSCPRITSFLIMSLLALGRTQDVLELGRTICNPANAHVLDRLRPESFEALNATLSSANLPQREASAKRLQIGTEIAARREAKLNALQQQQQQQAGGADNAALWTAAATAATTTKATPIAQTAKTSSSSSSNLVPAQVSEKMLEFGRTRNWSEALSLLHSLNLRQHSSQFSLPSAGSGSSTQQIGLANSVTLLYNCAISAAVDRPETVDELVADMKLLNLQPNATTTNTIMTSLGKTEDRWAEALDLFNKSTTPRDASTFSVALSVLGKRSLWQQASAVFGDMKKQPGMTKPTTVAFGLLIQATHKDSWELTLRAFQDMVKLHGAASAREVVVNRVVKSLDAAGRSAEATKLLESLRKGGSGNNNANESDKKGGAEGKGNKKK